MKIQIPQKSQNVQNAQKPQKPKLELPKVQTQKQSVATHTPTHTATAQNSIILKPWKKPQTQNVVSLQKSNEQKIAPKSNSLLHFSDLDPSQKRAVTELQNQQFGVIIGSAGTGKSTTCDVLLQKLLPLVSTESGVNYAQIAIVSFTGKAVQSIKEKLQNDLKSATSTIHALLEFKPYFEDRIAENGEIRSVRLFQPTRNSTYPLKDLKILIIDEAGTVKIDLWHQLLDALPEDCRIYMMGDINQLQPVGGHPILGFSMLKWPTFELTELHRNAGPIAIQANRILHGLWPENDEIEKRVILRKVPSNVRNAKKELLGVVQHLYKTNRFNPFEDTIIVPQNVGDLGKDELNKSLVQIFNNSLTSNHKRIAIHAGFETQLFAVNDKVMLLKNNPELGLTNGQTGKIVQIEKNMKYGGEVHEIQNFLNTSDSTEFTKLLEKDLQRAKEKQNEEKESIYTSAASHIVHVEFESSFEPGKKIQIAFATAGEVNSLTLAYAITCHKAQGSEYPLVIVFLHSLCKRPLCREWIYTAITRAKNRVIVLYEHEALSYALRTQRIRGNTMAEKIAKFKALMKLKKGEEDEVQLPEPRKIQQLQLGVKS